MAGARGRITRAELGRKLREMTQDMRQRFNVSVSGGLAIERGQIRDARPKPFTARLTAKKNTGANPYEWVEVVGDDAGGWEVPEGARAGSDAYEVNGLGSLGQAVVMLHPSEVGDHRFSMGGTCVCPQTLCISVVCQGTTTAINGAAVVVKDDKGATVASCTSGYRGDADGADFDGVDDYLSCSDTASLRSADGFWVSVWVKPDGVTGTRTIMRKTNDTGTDWALYQVGSDVRFQVVSYNSTTYEVTATGALTAGAWALVVAYLDPTAQVLGISINGGTATTAAAAKQTVEVTTTWSFASNMDSWTWVAGGSTGGAPTAAWEASDGSPAAGCVQLSTSGTAGDGYWYKSLTPAALGVPTGKTLSTLRMNAIRTKAYLVPTSGGPGPGDL